MNKNISEILEQCSKLESKEDRIAFLQVNQNPTLKLTLNYAFNPSVKWLLPDTDVPYKPNQNEDARNMYYAEARRLYLFVEGGNPNLTQTRRETLFISFLESICPEDAKMVAHMIKGKGLPYKGINKSIALKAFSDLF